MFWFSLWGVILAMSLITVETALSCPTIRIPSDSIGWELGTDNEWMIFQFGKCVFRVRREKFFELQNGAWCWWISGWWVEIATRFQLSAFKSLICSTRKRNRLKFDNIQRLTHEFFTYQQGHLYSFPYVFSSKEQLNRANWQSAHAILSHSKEERTL